jgi:hypothetical protein
MAPASQELIETTRRQAALEAGIEGGEGRSSPELLRRDVHPAEVSLPDGQIITGVRVFVTSHRLVAFKVSESREIVKVLDLELEQPCTVPADRGTLGAGRLEVRLADGHTAWVNRGQGCGCGSPLKALGPPVPWVRR